MELLTRIGDAYAVSIFADIVIDIDHDLPKYKKSTDVKILTNDEITTNPFVNGTINYDITPTQDHGVISLHNVENASFIKKLFYTISEMFAFNKQLKADKKKAKELQKLEDSKISVIDFFSHLKTELTDDESKDYAKLANTYIKQMGIAKQMGQTALYEKLLKEAAVSKYESILSAKGFKYLTQDQVIQLGTKTKRGIMIDYVKNFGRIIPEDVFHKKVEADELMVFDNYVVVYYDPDDKTHIKTEKERKEEEEKKKDPILFGVIMGSTKLYYITDWIDPYCDLTLEKAMEIIGSEDEQE